MTLRPLRDRRVDTPTILSVLQPRRHGKTVSLSRLRERNEAVLDAAVAAGYGPAGSRVLGYPEAPAGQAGEGETLRRDGLARGAGLRRRSAPARRQCRPCARICDPDRPAHWLGAR
jgi:hypothetical protein